MKSNKIFMAGALAFSMVLSGGMLTGCSSTSTDTKDTKTTEIAKKKEAKTLGQKSKDSKSLKFTNSTGKKITVFETKSSSEENFSDNLLENGDVVKNKEERTLYYGVKESDKLDVKIGLQDEDKTFVFKDVDTEDTKKVDVSLKEDKVNVDVTKKDGSTATLTPSEDSVKTEEEKKDESEVKKEEKKEETAKADTSNKSNTSESKKENTTATTNTSSNKNNSSTSSSKPAEHTHDWVAQYKTVNVPEKGHNEQVMVQAAYDEQVPVTEMQEICVGNQSCLQINGDPNEYLLNNSNGDSGWHSEWRETVVGYKTVHHDAVYETRYVVDSPATTKQELTGYKCSSCGKMKAN